MPKCLSGASCLSLATANPVQPIWITDAVLADAFRKLTQSSRRHGSNVPGPLESRNRASKRRNTGLAYAGGAPPIDPAILFSKRPRDTWWQKEPETETVSPQLIFPRWLFPPPDPPPAPELPPALELLRDGLREKISPIQEATSDTPRPSLRSEFLQCSSVEDIHELLAKRNIDLRQDPVTKLFIGSLLRRWTPTNIADFLTDPDLNPSGTNHHVRVMACLRSIPAQDHSPWRKVEDRNIIVQALCRAIDLGLLDSKDIEDIVAALPPIEISGPSEILVLPSQSDVLVMTYSLLQSLQSSSILSVEDLSLDFRNDLRSQIAAAMPSPISLRLLTILNEATSQDKDPVPVEMIITWLSSHCERKDLPTMTAIGDYLLTLSDSSLARALSNVTETLFLTTRNDRGQMMAFEAWAEILVSTHLSIPAELLRESTNVERAGRGVSSKRTRTETVLMSYWLQHTLQTHHPRRKGTVLYTLDIDLQCQIRSTLSFGSNVLPLDWLVDTNQVLQCLPIPNKRSVLLKLTNSVKDLLLANAPSQLASLATAKGCLQACQILADDAFYETAKRHFKHELTRFCELITSDLPQFKVIVQSLIDRRDMTKLKVVSRVMKHNRVFQLGLAQHRRERGDWREVLMADNIAIVRSKPYHSKMGLSGDPHPDAAIQLPPSQSLLDVIDHIAVSFATNPHESAQTAYNRVRQLWRFLRSHRVPAGPVITRCLWHAGIARQGSEGTSQAQLKWVSERVRRTEGKLIARLLMSNPAFRVHRKAVLETVQKTCEDAEKTRKKEDKVSRLLPKPCDEVLAPIRKTQADGTAQEPQRWDTLERPSIAEIIDWIARPKTESSQAAELAALEQLADASFPGELSGTSLEKQQASLESLLGSSVAQRFGGSAHQSPYAGMFR